MRSSLATLVPSLAALVAAALASSSGAAAGATPSPRSSSRPVLAVEDTLHTEVPPELVAAPRVTLDEILNRVARGEAKRESSIVDQSFLATMRVVRNDHNGKPPLLLSEDVQRVYKRRPDQMRTIQLRHYEYKPEKKKDDGPPKKEDDGGSDDQDFDAGFGERMVNFAFQPDARRSYHYRIEDRKLLGDHLVYRIAFEPISALDFDDPSGTVWVDTKEYVIVRQELTFRTSPFPILLKGLPRLVIERQKVGDTWVLSRMLGRIELTVPIPTVGRAFDFAMMETEVTVNAGLPDSLFGAAPHAVKVARR